jgi:hypothetical protein
VKRTNPIRRTKVTRTNPKNRLVIGGNRKPNTNMVTFTKRIGALPFVSTLLATVISLSWSLAIGRAQQPDNDAPGTQALTRGPVHEAFAGMVTFNPEPGVVVTKSPPDVIEELPPEERPEGDNVTWIPGYWGWDDERNDFLWVSGTWRTLPPGRAWMAGYWGKSTQGYQWTSGYWADASVRETTYLPPPPATVEVGPNIAAPSVDFGWSPGCWIWYQGRYAWRPGYWAQGRADWDWCPAHYVWTPRGYIFVGGFWDYPIARRGVLFAPVYFESGVYARRGYSYSPRIVIDLGVFTDHLFLRPSYHHYYFGDYYAPSYHQGGFYASFSFHTSRYGYDPIYSHQRWEHRQDRKWEHNVQSSYQYRRDHEAARPPRTWAAQRTINPVTAESRQNRAIVATSIDQLAKRKDTPMRFQPVAREERQKLSQVSREVQTSREQRRTLEAKAANTDIRKPGEVFAPAQVQLPQSPIVAKRANQLAKNQAPPEAQRAPKPDPKFQPKSEPSARQPDGDRNNPPRQPRKPESEKEKKAAPGPSEAPPRETQVQPVPPLRVTESAAEPQEESQRKARGLEKKAQLEPEPGAKTPAVSQRDGSGPEKKSQPKSEQRVQDAAAKPPKDLQRNAPGLERKAQPASEQPAQASAGKAREESQGNMRGPEKKAQRVSEQPAKARPAEVEKGAAKLLKKDRPKEGKGKPSPPEKLPVPPSASP